jgi:hypothetical protein
VAPAEDLLYDIAGVGRLLRGPRFEVVPLGEQRERRFDSEATSNLQGKVQGPAIDRGLQRGELFPVAAGSPAITNMWGEQSSRRFVDDRQCRKVTAKARRIALS